MEPKSVLVVLIGPNALLREGLSRILTTADFEVAASRSRVDDHVVAALTREAKVLLIIDIGDDFGSAMSQIEYYKRQCPEGRVVVLAHQHQFSEMVSAYRSGANAYFVTIASCEVFIKSIELVMLGETVLPPTMLTIVDGEREPLDSHRIGYSSSGRNGDVRLQRYQLQDIDSDLSGDEDTEINDSSLTGESCAPRLSARHKSILSCLIEGHSNKIIARRMKISEATVKVHVKAILRRVRVHNRTQAAIWAMNSGLFHPAKEADRPAAVTATASALDADVWSPEFTNGSSPAGTRIGARHGMLPNLDPRLRIGGQRTDN
ncbi:Transcriptional regulatory protein [Bosea sp. LC85]|nr:Transcriptional regulatory protein [Bosea sp. LC85]